MKIETKTTHTITFRVEAFWNEEGGMGNASFGGDCETLADAIRTLEVARTSEAKKGLKDRTNWIITADVDTSTI